MSVGPLRRLAAAVALVALAPTAVMLAADLITPVDAAVRAAVTVVGVLSVARLAGWWLGWMASGLERDAGRAGPGRATPARRALDRDPRRDQRAVTPG